jgi:putative cell wall-binding protein
VDSPYDSVPDALVAAAAAGATNEPLLYVGAGTPIDSYTAAELTRLDPSQIVVVGDATTISAAVLDALAPYITP